MTERTVHDPRQAASRWYVAQHERHSAEEVRLVSQGRYQQAENHHAAALALAWGLEAEMTNRTPAGLPK